MKHCIIALAFFMASWASAAPAEKIDLHVGGLDGPKHGWYEIIDAFEEKYPHIPVVAGPAGRGADIDTKETPNTNSE